MKIKNRRCRVELGLLAASDRARVGVVGLAPKWVRLDPKLEKSGTFSDQIRKNPVLAAFGANLSYFGPNSDILI